MTRRRSRDAACLLSACVAAGAMSEPAAQETGAPTSTLEKVEVVGSHLPRSAGEGPSPVTVIGRAQIEASGVARVSELLLELPYTNGLNFDDRATVTMRDPLQGAAGAALRGLGVGATLVLLNGRRLAPYGVPVDNDESFVDLNSLPLAAVERIEILRDGASAIYGADALAGVINIVLRRDFSGAEAALRWSRSTHGDLDEKFATLTLGAGNLQRDRYNVFATVDVLRQQALPMSARDFSRSGDQRPRGGSDWRSIAGFPPTVLPLSAPNVQPGPGCPPEQVTVLPDGANVICSYDLNTSLQLLPKVERSGVLVVGTLDLGAATSVFTELSFNRTRTQAQFAPVPVFAQFLSATVPTNPLGEDLLFWWRPVENAPRLFETTADFARAIAGVRGRGAGWDWEAVGGYNRIDTDFRRGNDLLNEPLFAALDSGQLDPFSNSNDPALLASMNASTLDRYRSTLGFVSARGSSEVARLAHGALALALGVEARRESFATRLDPLSLSGALLGTELLASADSQGARNVQALFGELSVPLARDLQAQLALRYDRYSDFGDAFSPKLALRWQAQPRLMLRASAGRGFLPPTLFQLNKPPMQFVDEVNDPVRCPVTQAFEDCFAIINHFDAGNPALGPETSHQYNVGLVLDPTDALSLSIDAWRIEHRDRIVFGHTYFIDNEALFPDRVVRAPATAADIALGLPGPLLELRDTYINLARQEVRGVDVELKLRGPARPYGRTTLALMASYLDRFSMQFTPDAPVEQRAGNDSYPRLKLNASVDWERAAWQARLAARYISSYDYFDGVEPEPRTVASFTAIDASLGRKTSWGQVTLLVRNLADRQPPMRNVLFGYDPLTHDPRGRLVSLTLRYRL